MESQHYNLRPAQGASPTHSSPQKQQQQHLHQGIIGSLLGIKGSMRAASSDEIRSMDSQSLNMHTNTNNVPGSARSKSNQGQTSREENHGSKHPMGSPINSNTGLPSLPLRTSKSPSINSGFNTSSRSAHAAATTHYHSHSSHVQSLSHSASRGAGGGRGSGLNPSGEARATLGEKVSITEIVATSQLSRCLIPTKRFHRA